MGKKRKYKYQKCKELEQKANEENQQEETRRIIFAFPLLLILFGLSLNYILACNENTSVLEESKTIKNEMKVMELLDMKIQICNKESELQSGIYPFHLESDTSCNTYKSEYRKLEEKYNTTKWNNNEINKDTK
ncbi:TPA: hypothetical protein RLU70_003783 [Escherichia coli]|uniref:hypothetical protein n=1 Tax=Klebsiella pneumoniae TaxID=573 RepID=UPI001323D741|nr:hypothetical protein [Klebsiella pneumoniae]ECQ3126445.1 hypothetical protein [Salmonella enterica]EDY8719473.1 hypothetical protein [Salmonella enterica]UBN06046.1 hypothetical protein LB481_28575 [Klebsiella pneumoniae]HDW2569225.1 hypothetical protein [Escherichia coli]